MYTNGRLLITSTYMSDFVRFTAWLKPKQINHLRKVAKQEQVPVTQLIRSAITKVFKI